MKRLAILAFVVAVASPARADPAPMTPPTTPFDQGRFGVSLGAGTQNAFDSDYVVIGAGIGYFVLDGVEIGVALQHDFPENDGPSINLVSPSLRYVARPLVGKFPLIPYVGVFYDHYFVGGFPDVDGVGASVGFLYLTGRAIFGLGIAVEKTVSTCDGDCTSVYPDITIGFSF